MEIEQTERMEKKQRPRHRKNARKQGRFKQEEKSSNQLDRKKGRSSESTAQDKEWVATSRIKQEFTT
jgi:hypothetical protein